ncbi:MBL fold metallo-hydrolase [Halorussus aquaticus]|uniref:MBL fold metallo-hydrolase n=1 Tax=Halorussus aquaticus TaxID=2953748 RepID=A0ABD5Q3V6_9EURY|nr:MBL fold metallo-hydrolase [Halorussus aquaticus]
MFRRLSIPTPFQVGPVNAYLAGRTLVDPGPGSEEAWAALLDGLEARGLGPTDIERVLITHPHPDTSDWPVACARRARESSPVPRPPISSPTSRPDSTTSSRTSCRSSSATGWPARPPRP